MTTETDSAVDVLNELLAVEAGNPLPRLRESTVFLTWATAEERRSVDRMIDEEIGYQAQLVDAIISLGGEPVPTTANIHTANLHFLDLGFALRRVLSGLKASLAVYESALDQLGHNERAVRVVSDIAAGKRRHVDLLSRIVDRAHPDQGQAAGQHA